jgi:hypothetical protein
MGYSGPSLAVVYDFEDSAARLCHDLADEGGDRMTDATRELTPVGHQPFNQGYMPGHLLESISKKIVVVYFDPVHGCMVYESGSETNVEYAIYVENGTGLWGPARAKYEIRPKNPLGWLRWLDDTGKPIFAKRVMHPGSPGAHMFARGAAKTEDEFHLWANHKIERWAVIVEREISLRAKAKVLRS